MTELVTPRLMVSSAKTLDGTGDDYFPPESLTREQLEYFGKRLGFYEKNRDGEPYVNPEYIRLQYAQIYAGRDRPACQAELDRLHARFFAFRLKASQI
jgi:hypothetical protein